MCVFENTLINFQVKILNNLFKKLNTTLPAMSYLIPVIAPPYTLSMSYIITRQVPTLFS